jgi:hypothetical protein
MAKMTLAAVIMLTVLASCSSYDAEEASLPHTLLNQALQAVQAHDSEKALDALNKAENAWLGTNVPFSDAFFNFDPEAMREMGRARQSIQMQRWADAEYYIRTAMTHPSTLTPN